MLRLIINEKIALFLVCQHYIYCEQLQFRCYLLAIRLKYTCTLLYEQEFLYNFDNNNFSFIDLLSESDGIGPQIITNIDDNQLKIGWFSLQPVSFEKDTLINLRFLRVNGCFTFC